MGHVRAEAGELHGGGKSPCALEAVLQSGGSHTGAVDGTQAWEQWRNGILWDLRPSGCSGEISWKRSRQKR